MANSCFLAMRRTLTGSRFRDPRSRGCTHPRSDINGLPRQPISWHIGVALRRGTNFRIGSRRRRK
jgi:hypothetical protein